MSRLNPVLVAFVCLGCCPTFCTFGGQPDAATKVVTLVVAFDGNAAQPSVVEALKSELAEIWRSEAVKLDWRPLSSIKQGDSFEELVVVHFKGDCQVHPESFAAYLIDERGPQGGGPLAYTSTVDGEVQPFSSVLCDRVSRSVQSALEPGQRKAADLLFGRALGRVLSHEVYHVLNQTLDHRKQGLAKRSLTAKQLIAPEFHFDEARH